MSTVQAQSQGPSTQGIAAARWYHIPAQTPMPKAPQAHPMSYNWMQHSRAELRQYATHSYRQGGGSRPDVLLIEINGHKAVLKDQNAADPWFAWLIGPLLNWRETNALKRLADCEVTPTLLGVPDRRSFLMSFHPSLPITERAKNPMDWPLFFERLEHSIHQMHEIGVAHNDLRNPTNTLITDEGHPVLVDLVAYFSQGSRWNWPRNWIFRKFCQVDLSAITKLKLRYAPELVTESDIHPEHIAGQSGMRVKRFGQWVRRVTRALFTQ